MKQLSMFMAGFAFGLIIGILIASPAFAENKYNPMTGEFEVVPDTYQLQFNRPNGEWSYAPPGAQTELNRSTLNFEYPGSRQTGPQVGDQQDFTPPEYQRFQQQSNRPICAIMSLPSCD